MKIPAIGPCLMYWFTFQGRGPGAVVKAAFFESERLRVRAPLWTSSAKETIISSPLTRKDSILWGAFVTKS